jgi:HD-GYP domain-containing protein (c-di-GMP phosphodiesterase class II)
MLHAIGKVYVPAEILSKPGRLSEPEFNMIKAHAQLGHDILKVIEFRWPIAQMILQHHERMNGSGYPSGLSGESILLEARLLAVADVVDAMTHHRPYRPARGIDNALEEISKNSGILYDARVVEACLRLLAGQGQRLYVAGDLARSSSHAPTPP